MLVNGIIFASRTRTLVFRDPVEIILATRTEEVLPALRCIEARVDSGLSAAGFVSYEAAGAFDPALSTHAPGGLPLLCFGLYREAVEGPPALASGGDYTIGPWEAAVSPDEYFAALARVREWIGAGDTYQVNFTIPLRSTFQGDARACFSDLRKAQDAEYAAFLDAGNFQILSLSPELFFRLDGDQITTRPMKGTRRRGLYPGADEQAYRDLKASEKDRAENLMIVDLIRNDLGRIAKTGSVRVHDLFQIERYETVWQMTSSVTARTTAGVPEIFAALFPCGSVTGAPKVRTMQIIRELEHGPRGVYCGSMGWWQPGRKAEFNVAIRTLTIDRASGQAEYHVGGGITWDSTPADELDECYAKAAVLTCRRPDFELLESILWDGAYALLDEHLTRLESSAAYFGFSLDPGAIRIALQGTARELPANGHPFKVRLLVARDGTFRVEADPLITLGSLRMGLAADPVDMDDVFLYHKTTCRAAYDRARASRPDCDDVLLWNTRGEITESTLANVVAKIGGTWFTPPVASGLLAGTMRASLLANGEISERTLTWNDLVGAQELRLINSVRGWIAIRLAGDGTGD